MTETSIFEHLLDDGDCIQKDINPLLIPDSRAKICAGLAEEVNIATKKRSYSPHYIRNVLELISKLSKSDEKHHQVDTITRPTILRLLEKEYRNDDDIQDIDQYVQEIKIKKLLMYDTIKKNILKIQEEKVMKQQLILESLRIKVKDLELSTGLEFNLRTPQKINEYNGVQFMNTKTFNEEEEIKKNPGKLKDKNYRLKHVSFGYALLTIGYKEEFSVHFSFLLESLSRYEEMHDFERRFCWHLLGFIDKYPSLIGFFKDQLFFIVEIKLIDVCKDLIKSPETNIDHFFSESKKNKEMEFLITASKRSNSLYAKIKNLLYTLYFLSNFNQRIIELINKMNIAVQC